MENASRELMKVHIARPTFLASDQLSVGIENFMKIGVVSPRFLFLASKRVIINHEEYFDKNFLKTLAKARHDFGAHREQLGIDPNIGIRLMGNGALRFQVRPLNTLDTTAFHAALDEVDVLPNLGQSFIGPQRHFLQASIAGNLLGTNEDMAAAAKRLRERLADPATQHLYSVKANDIQDAMTEIPVMHHPQPEA